MAVNIAPTNAACHVFLCVPNVTLRTEISGVEIGSNNSRDDGLNDFEKLFSAASAATESQIAHSGLACAERTSISCMG